VLPVIATILPLTSISLSDQIISYGILAYLLIFVVIMFTSTVVGGPIPDNTLLILIGAAATNSGLSMEGLFIVAVMGGFVGYEINYWCGRLFGLKICRGACPLVLHDKNVQKAIDLMDRFGPAALILSRFMPVLNLPSFIEGVNAMEYRKYVIFDLISSVVWCGTLLVLGYYIGTISIINQYLDDLTNLVFIIMGVAIIVVLVMFVRDYMKQQGRRSPE